MVTSLDGCPLDRQRRPVVAADGLRALVRGRSPGGLVLAGDPPFH